MNEPDRRMALIWKEWYRPLAAFIRHSYGLSGELEDLMQEIMLKVYQNLGNYDARWALSTWLYAIARNCCLDWLKRRRLPITPLETEPSGPDSVESRVLANEIDLVVDRLMATLDPIDRGIAWLAFYERAPYRRIAAIFGLPLSTVKKRIHTIRSRLKRALEDFHA